MPCPRRSHSRGGALRSGLILRGASVSAVGGFVVSGHACLAWVLQLRDLSLERSDPCGQLISLRATEPPRDGFPHVACRGDTGLACFADDEGVEVIRDAQVHPGHTATVQARERAT